MYMRNELSNGIRVIGWKLPGIRSVTVGIWVKAGSVVESSTQNGMSHFIEHMLFKGTEKRTYKQIAEEMDNIGAQLNAFTSKECTCYYAKVIDEKQAIATDILCDMFCNSVLSPEEIEKEKGVVLEEISMTSDTPDDVVHEKLAEAFYVDSPLAKTILGPSEVIESLTREKLMEYKNSHYSVDNVIVVAVGNYDESLLIDQLEKHLSNIPKGDTTDYVSLERHTAVSGFQSVEKDIEQVHIAIGMRSYDFMDDRKYAMSIVNNILGGGMSSRLFQKIREEKGMAYSVYSYPSVYSGSGMLCVYAGTSPKNANTVVEMILEELRNFEPMTSTELVNIKEQMRGSFILGQESNSSKMNFIGKNLLLLGETFTEADVLNKIANVRMADVEEATHYMFSSPYSAAIVGAIKGFNRSILE